MSQAASQYAAFARDVAAHRRVWTVCDDGGYPAPMTASGRRSWPFWSNLARVRRILATVPAYAGFRPVEISWEAFRDDWLAEIESDGLLVGVNWSGPRAVGYDVEPAAVRARVEREIAGSPDRSI
jgi:Protein of unknown function (DUF2750)